MAELALGSVGNMVQIALAIKEAVDLVQQNKEDCDKIKKRVIRATGILQQLDEKKLINHETMSGALEDLEETLRDALTVVTACQEKHIACLFCMAGDQSKQLRRVQEDISDQMMTGILAININATFLLAELQCPAPSHPPQDAGPVVVWPSNHGTDDSARFGKYNVETSVSAESEALSHPIPGLRKFSLSEAKDATNDFSEENIIGSGGFGTVYKGVLHDGLVVAIKKLDDMAQFETPLMHLKNEFIILSKHQHKNIVKLLGYVIEVEEMEILFHGKYVTAKKRHVFVVHEYMPNGDLGTVSSLGWSGRFQIIQGIAEGLQYLHEQQVIHMDLKPDNILLDSDNNPKIHDFGIARMLGQGVTYATCNVVGTIGYMPPEYLVEGIVSPKADVYAFGVTLLQTISGICRSGPSGASSSVEWAWNVRETGQAAMDFDPSLYHESQIKDIKRCIKIGLLCAQNEPRHRPTMTEVLEMLNSKRKLPTPKKPGFI